jgi:hypothetical protein
VLLLLLLRLEAGRPQDLLKPRAHDFLQYGFLGMVSITRWSVPGFFWKRPYSLISLAFSLSCPFSLEFHRTAIMQVEDCEHAFRSSSDAPIS